MHPHPTRARADKVTAAVQRLDQGVRTLTDSDHYAAYLQAMGRFHAYSAHNVLLIWTQRSEATRVGVSTRSGA